MSLLKASSIALRSGLYYGGRSTSVAPAASIAARTPARLWLLRLPITTTSPGRDDGASCCSAEATNMARRYGRAPVGERLVCPVPHGHWKTTTFVATLRVGGLTAPLVIDGAMTGDLFVAYVEQQLVPTLRPGDVVVLDNLSSHKRARVRELIEARGCTVLFLPPYSPDLNPIELAFAKLKALLRKAGERTVEEIGRAHV